MLLLHYVLSQDRKWVNLNIEVMPFGSSIDHVFLASAMDVCATWFVSKRQQGSTLLLAWRILDLCAEWPTAMHMCLLYRKRLPCIGSSLLTEVAKLLSFWQSAHPCNSIGFASWKRCQMWNAHHLCFHPSQSWKIKFRPACESRHSFSLSSLSTDSTWTHIWRNECDLFDGLPDSAW